MASEKSSNFSLDRNLLLKCSTVLPKLQWAWHSVADLLPIAIEKVFPEDQPNTLTNSESYLINMYASASFWANIGISLNSFYANSGFFTSREAAWSC